MAFAASMPMLGLVVAAALVAAAVSVAGVVELVEPVPGLVLGAGVVA